MSTRGLVTPDLLALIDAQQCDPLTADSLAEFRRVGADRRAELPTPAVTPDHRLAPGRGGAPDVPLSVYRPPHRQARSAAVLHCHGGGMISGAPEISAYASAATALDLGLVVISVGYRLAPENPFPSPQEDCYAALAWMYDQAETLDIDPDRIVVSGDSAGGGLAAALALMVRDRGAYRLAGQVLTYPMLDHRTGGPDDPHPDPRTGEFAWTRQRNCFAWAALRGDNPIDDAQIGWFSPSCAYDLTNLPPTWLGVGELDLFTGECEVFARRLTDAGVAAELVTYPGAIHGFNGAPEAQVSRRYCADLRAAFTRFALGSP